MSQINCCSSRKVYCQHIRNIYSADSSGVQPWFSDSITVTERNLFLQPASRRFPISPRENDTFSPAAGVIIYDVLNNAPADTKYLSKYTWEGTIGLLYDDVYPGQVLGTTTQRVEKGSNEVLFNDVVLSDWGYSYILKISMRAKETAFWNLTCLIGPFDVDILDTFEMPLIESEEYRQLKIIFDGNFKAVKADQRKFEIFFLNLFGRKYPQVRWKNLTVSEGSVVVDFIITGLTNELDKTSKELAYDIGSGKADIEYLKGTKWKASTESVPSRKLLENPGTTDGQSAEEGAGGLSVAWIVAIVINVVLITVFIISILYCWIRRKKQNDSIRSGSSLNYDGDAETMIANKAESKKKSMEEKAALMNAGHRGDIFTIEDGRRGLHKHKHEDEDERCNCFSPACYCSVGDGRKTESRLDRSG
ncbi:uncharacterized protein CDAR_193981 [Caerostris darwini]|uniref:Uncharacterized protein n=1 Tax=Caerostris darwini TaxID=1538125 RepID=A0AAV4T5K0_9ARAC|nr:uncharacterized protein CDAR_193981 [Caerostris darwini]